MTAQIHPPCLRSLSARSGKRLADLEAVRPTGAAHDVPRYVFSVSRAELTKYHQIGRAAILDGVVEEFIGGRLRQFRVSGIGCMKVDRLPQSIDRQRRLSTEKRFAAGLEILSLGAFFPLRSCANLSA